MESLYPFRTTCIYSKRLFFILLFLLFSCSSEEKCDEVLIPNGNEFTVGCERFSTPIGQMNVNQSPFEETLSCRISFANNPNGNGFRFTEEDNNINLVEIWLIIKGNPPNGTNLIPNGTYKLDKSLTSFSQLREFDIVDSNRVYVGAEIIDCCFENYEAYYGTYFESIEVDIQSEGGIYTIEYVMDQGDNAIRGRFVGELDVVDLWP